MRNLQEQVKKAFFYQKCSDLLCEKNYSNRSEQVLVTECFFNLFLPGDFLYESNKLEQSEFKLEKNIGI